MNRFLLGMIVLSLCGCSSHGVWRHYSPAMSDLIGTVATSRKDQIIVGNKIKLLNHRPIEIITYDGTSEDSTISSDDRTVALDLIYKQVILKLGATSVEKIKTTASNTKVDILNNWAWVPINQTFAYAGLRADSATIDFTSTQQLTAGTFKYDDIGTIEISAKGSNEYHAVISNPKVYYRIQLARVVQTFPGDKYSNGWRTRRDPNINPIILSEQKKETWPIQPHQWFWNRWFGDEMPWLSLVLEKGKLFIRSTRGIQSDLIPLDTFEKNSQWNERSAYLLDFPVGDFKRKFVVLDIEAKRNGDTVVIEHARIRYPEVRLQVID
ncbi:hypothetical protein [Desulfobacula phenolica]|uniref:Uncharacterized protein n=1 Tax=Desulfobacula phenolica TaxID=90732 RepID=A0A1H2KID5_9BACT|nr:hypothetical protein [Desulfobacula phenolica]SDU68095.1 hypothetical protein SAMN04487931_1521 [Desulfobacula phenolica]